MQEKGLRGIIKDMQEDKEYLDGIGDIYDAEKTLRKLKELEKEIEKIRDSAIAVAPGAVASEKGVIQVCCDILGQEIK